MRGRPKQAAGKIAKDTLRRYPTVPLHALARYLVHAHEELFPDHEVARAKLRYYAGKNGKYSRQFHEDPGAQSGVRMPNSRVIPRNDYNLKPGTWLILSDAHVPFHMMKPLEAAIQYGQTQRVDGVLLNGDWQDCAALSYWPQDKREFHKEVEAVIDSLDFLRHEFPKAKIVYKPGNHEERLHTYYRSKAPELIGAPQADLETVLSLEARDIEFLERKQKIMAGELSILHGNELRGGTTAVNPARWLFLKAKASALCGHFHRTSQHDETNLSNHLQTTWSVGCLCDLHPDFAPHANNWNWGFAIVHVEKDGNYFVENRRILPNGKVV